MPAYTIRLLSLYSFYRKNAHSISFLFRCGEDRYAYLLGKGFKSEHRWRSATMEYKTLLYLIILWWITENLNLYSIIVRCIFEESSSIYSKKTWVVNSTILWYIFINLDAFSENLTVHWKKDPWFGNNESILLFSLKLHSAIYDLESTVYNISIYLI